MPQLTLREAARQVGVSRQTVYRLVKLGKLSATVGHDGQKIVDTAELLRVFGTLAPNPPPLTSDSTRQPTTAPATAPGLQAMTAEERRREVETADRAALRAELVAARETIRRLEDQVQEAKEREAKLLDLAAAQTRLLEHRELAENPPKGFWRRLFGG